MFSRLNPIINQIFFNSKQPGNENLKILIVSTPKTGNTWLRYLLAAIYDLPMVTVTEDTIEETDQTHLGARWVSQEHFVPTSKVIEWTKKNQVILITTIRHPGDVLISHYHYIRDFSNQLSQINQSGFFTNLLSENQNKEEEFTNSLIRYVSRDFMFDLHNSISWIRSKQSFLVRYEDLWRDPLTTLVELTSKIQPVSEDAIERAVDRCEISQLRNSSENKKFFRKGGIGGWRESIPPEVLELFRKAEPYPDQFNALGYSLDPTDPLIADPVKLRINKNPFINITHFDNGIPVIPLFVDLYLSIETRFTRNWQPIDSTKKLVSFYSWLNESSELDNPEQTQLPIITNLGAYIYHTRLDLQAVFPDLYGQHRIDFVIWFMQSAQAEYKLAEAFIHPLISSLKDWPSKPIEEDSAKTGPVITNLAYYYYQHRPDVRAAFPDIFDRDRVFYNMWVINQAPIDHHIDSSVIEQVRNKFLEWANNNCPEDTTFPKNKPVITNYMYYLYKSDLELQSSFPDIFGLHRVDFASWFILINRNKTNLEKMFSIPVVVSWARS